MTGFGRACKDCADFDVTVDVSSVNKKGFELSVSLPRDWYPMERLVAQTLKKSIARGKVSVSIKIEKRDNQSGLGLDAEKLSPAVLELKKLCADFGEKNVSITPDLILKIDERLSQNANSPDWEIAWETVELALLEATEKLDEMRLSEGIALKSDIDSRLDTIENLVGEVEKNSAGTVQKYKEQLLQRLATSALELDPNDERVLKEVCIFADKCDICEEITRLKSHIAQFRATMQERNAVGRKMDFICQEMGREINTTASKANSLELTKLAIELKNELERIREQTQNIE